jgi:hypothetical protein
MKSFFFLMLVIVAAWISSGIVVYKNHDRIKKIVDSLPANTTEDLQKGCSAAYQVGKATYSGGREIFFGNSNSGSNNEYAQDQQYEYQRNQQR